ncbi:ubiquinone biosynthesis protein UbiA (plasmid) [Halorarum halophilum]|uniref:Ubiquinone biosynthesis protein UbiA n=1 Tax=Halorarum halophilum TaxID=2743090 RepID=A0A7D5GEA3_9EURY|nr:UbiA family prenyltransferase [Halobaculum halophilum]QLG29632.1 ubiquinone biosynthesis protein UbiA [Halobaculum halophilum]
MPNRRGVEVVRALASQVKPTFMLPAIGMAAFGGLLAPVVSPTTFALHVGGVGLALYVAHLVDEYVDTYVRGEEEPAASRRVLALGVVLASVGFLALLLALASTAGPLAGLSLLPLWILALLHAPVLDRNTVAVTADYPTGIAVALCGGFLTQTGRLPPLVVALAAVFLVLLSGVKVAVDRLDVAFDRTVDKRTVPVVLGDRRAARAATGILAGAGALVLGFVAVGVLPGFAATAAAFSLGMAVGCVAAGKRRAVRVAILLTYPFAAALFLAACPETGCGPIRVAAEHAFGLTERTFPPGYL